MRIPFCRNTEWYFLQEDRTVKIVVGVTGATGVEMSYYLVKALKNVSDRKIEVHLVVSSSAKITWELECKQPISELYELADIIYDENNLAAAISSGSFVTDGMVIIPCSMKTLAGIAAGYAENLVLRAADVCLKENRRVILVPREMPFGRIHLRNMKEVADNGCIIIPPVLTFYNGGTTVEEQINHIIGKILMQFGITFDKFVSWEGK